MAVGSPENLAVIRPGDAVRQGHADEHGHTACAFRHEVILHGDGTDGFVSQTAPLIEEALQKEAPVMAAISRERADRLCEALGADSDLVLFLDVRELGVNPARIIPLWREFLAGSDPRGGEPLGIGEPVWPGRAPAEIDECVRHEALMNLAFAGPLAWRLLCHYDVDGLEDEVIETARRTHPLVAIAGTSTPNGAYSRQAPRPFDGHLEPAPERAQSMRFDEGGLPAVRREVTVWADGNGLRRESIEELVLAVDEIATNSIRYGGGEGTLQMWRETDALVCEVADRGHMRDPMLGRIRPVADALSGRGLWIVNHLCDLVQIRSSSEGTQVRMHKKLA